MASPATPQNALIRSLGERDSLLILAFSVTALLLGVMVGWSEWRYVAALAMVPLALRWPVEVCLGTFVLLLPFDSVAGMAGNNSRTLLWVAGALAACALLAVGLISRRLERPPRTALWLGLFICWAAFSIVWAWDPKPGLHRLPTAFSLLALYVAAAMFRLRKKEFKWIVAMIIMGGCAAAVVASYQYYRGTYYVGQYNTLRETLVIGNSETNPNGLAFNLIFPIALATAVFLSSTSWLRKMLMLGAIALIAFALFLTMSRSGLVALCVVAIVFAVRLRVKKKLLIVALALSPLLLLMPTRFFHRVVDAGQFGGAGRLYIYRVGWEIIKHQPIFGAGLDNFPVAYNKYAGFAPTFVGFSRAPHELYLGVSAELGVIGLLFLLLAINSQRKLNREQRSLLQRPSPMLTACEAVFWAMLIFGFVGNPLFAKGFWLSWIMLAFVLRLAKDEAAAPAPAEEFDYATQAQRYSPMSLQL